MRNPLNAEWGACVDSAVAVGRSLGMLIVGAAFTACASIEQRGLAAFDPPRAEPWTVYPGTLHDARTVRAAFAGDHLGGNAWLKAPVALLDLPLSITADTICLPYDAAVVANTPSPTAH
ncbi:YceK/YidQ family lipoprotein [Methylolobus aquaticus]|nr:YceK/YidQ family lipoprotein [Methylolobus aquaticus]